MVHDRARSPVTSRVAHLVAGNAVRAGCRAVQRAQVQGLTQGGRVATVAVEQLLAQAVHHDHAGVTERHRVNILLREAAGKVQRVGNSVERRVRIQGVRGARQASLSHQRGGGLQHIGDAIATVGGRGRQRRAQNIVQGGLFGAGRGRHRFLSGVSLRVWRVLIASAVGWQARDAGGYRRVAYMRARCRARAKCCAR